MERRQAHSFVLSRVRGATTMPRCDRDPSRRSTVAIFGRGPAPPSPAVAPEPTATCPRQAIAPGGRSPGPPAVRFAPPPRDATPRSALGSSPETPLLSEDINSYHSFAQSSINIFVS